MKSITIRVPERLHRNARIKSVEEDKSLNELLTEKLEEWVEADGQTKHETDTPKKSKKK